MTGAGFLRLLNEEYELTAAEQMLAEAAARAIDRACKTGSARDARAEDRLLNEIARTLFARADTGEQSTAGRANPARELAFRRWGRVS